MLNAHAVPHGINTESMSSGLPLLMHPSFPPCIIQTHWLYPCFPLVNHKFLYAYAGKKLQYIAVMFRGAPPAGHACRSCHSDCTHIYSSFIHEAQHDKCTSTYLQGAKNKSVLTDDIAPAYAAAITSACTMDTKGQVAADIYE